jgi:hypothetical protein
MPDFLPGIYFTFLNLSGFELTDKVKSSIEFFLKHSLPKSLKRVYITTLISQLITLILRAG